MPPHFSYDLLLPLMMMMMMMMMIVHIASANPISWRTLLKEKGGGAIGV
jgi:hypothetical protein